MVDTLDKDSKLYKVFEDRLVSSLIYDGSYSNRVFEYLDTESIEEPILKTVIESINILSQENEKVNLQTILHNVEQRGLLKDGLDSKKLVELYQKGSQYAVEATPLYYARAVREYHAKKTMKNILANNMQFFDDNSGLTATEALSNLQSQINDNVSTLSDDSMRVEVNNYQNDYRELLKKRHKIAEENKDNASGLQGVPTLLPTLNKITRGWQPGQMITVGARTGIGKSVLAVNCAIAAGQAGKTVLFFSLEMDADELYDRMIASIASVDLTHLKDGNLNDEEQIAVDKALEEISKMNIIIESNPLVTMDIIRSKATQQAQSDTGLDLIIVDYLQLITPPSKIENRQQQVAEFSRSIKILAKTLQVPIIDLVQLNREDKKKDDADRLPSLNDIRESASIAQDSDIVLIIHRENSYDGKTPITLIIVDKHRGGEANKIIRCHSNLNHSIFIEIKKDTDNENTEELNDYVDDDGNIVLDEENKDWSDEFDF